MIEDFMDAFARNSVVIKDFFWIIYTFAATVISALTYVKVRNSTKQSLFDSVIGEQVKLYSEMLETLGSHFGEFLGSCKFGNTLKFNLIAHLHGVGAMEDTDDGMCSDVLNRYTTFENMETLEELLEAFDILQFARNEVVVREPEANKEKVNVSIGQSVVVNNIRGLLWYTEALNKLYGQMGKFLNHVYMPRKTARSLQRFYEEFVKLTHSRVVEVLRQEEERIIAAAPGTDIEISFTHLENEVLEDTKKLERRYKALKRRIRKDLKIDERW